jgi:hypothetical protein
VLHGRKWWGGGEFDRCRYMKWEWLVDDQHTKSGNIYRRVKRKVLISIHKLMTIITDWFIVCNQQCNVYIWQTFLHTIDIFKYPFENHFTSAPVSGIWFVPKGCIHTLKSNFYFNLHPLRLCLLLCSVIFRYD